MLKTDWFLFKCACWAFTTCSSTRSPYPEALFRQLRDRKIDESSDTYFYELATYTKVNEAIYTDFLTSRQLSAFKFFEWCIITVLFFCFTAACSYDQNLWLGVRCSGWACFTAF